MIYLFITLVIVIFFAMPSAVDALGIALSSPIYTAFTYPLAHASFFHLAMNSLALTLLYQPAIKLYKQRFSTYRSPLVIVAYLCAVVAGLFSQAEIPTVGASGIAYALLGMIVILAPNKKQFATLLLLCIATIIQSFNAHINTRLHIIAFVLGITFICVRTFCYDYKHRYDTIAK